MTPSTPSTPDDWGTEVLEENPDLALWPRVRRAIYAATVSRAETLLHLPECHRKNCHRHGSDDVDLVFSMFADSIAESVHTELLCKATTEPDYGPAPGQEMGVHDAKDFRRIVNAELALRSASEKLTRAVQEARQHGTSWVAISVALGVSVSKTKRKYGPPESAGQTKSFGPRPRISTRAPREEP